MSQSSAPAGRSYASGTFGVALLGDTISDNFDRTVARFGDREALVDVAAGCRWTYRELAADVNALALGFLDRGVAKGERVGIWAPNCAEWIMVQYATAKTGAILVNINPAYGSRELEYVLRQSGIRTRIAAPKFRTSDYAGMIAEVRPRCRDLTEVVLFGTTSVTIRNHSMQPPRAGRNGRCRPVLRFTRHAILGTPELCPDSSKYVYYHGIQLTRSGNDYYDEHFRSRTDIAGRHR